jgi:DNA-binding MarR family transcriptional regulator
VHPLADIVIAHIGNVPVEEWLPFLFPVLALLLYGRHWSHRRRQALNRLPAAGEPIDDDTIDLVLSAWAKADQTELGRAHLPLLYPPGPDGATVAELAARAHSDPATVERLLEELEELGYLDLEEPGDGLEEPGDALEERHGGHDGARRARRVWLTASGFDLVNVTENALLASLSAHSAKPRRRGERSAERAPTEGAPS